MSIGLSENLAQSINDGLVGYWQFTNGGINDLSGSGNDGANNGASINSDRYDNPSGAYSFDGNTSIVLSNSSSLNITSNISIASWVKIPAGNGAVILRGYDTGNSFAGYGFAIGIGCSTGKLSFWSGDQGSWVCSSSIVSDDSWHHVAITTDGVNASFYIDGNLDTTIPCSNPNSYQGDRLIGNYQTSTAGSYFYGAIDELKLYNRNLSGAEISTLYSQEQESGCENIFCDGQNVGIGTANTKGYRLAVAGDIISEEVKVALIENWPDYIFEKDYELRTLEEVEEYIATKGHLPEIPNAAEVTENGINLGEMDAKLLQKIEELTLYLIEQNKEIKELKEKVKSLENN